MDDSLNLDFGAFHEHEEYVYSPDLLDYLDIALYKTDIPFELYTKLKEWAKYDGDWSQAPCTKEEREFVQHNRNKIYGSDTRANQLVEKEFLTERRTFRASPELAHYQLRHLVAPVSQREVYYSSVDGIQRLDPVTSKTNTVVRCQDCTMANKTSTLAADSELLCAGSITGQYVMKSLVTGQMFEGQLGDDNCGIVNHIDMNNNNSNNKGGRVLTVASNDNAVRQLDVATNKVTREAEFEYPINCTASSHNENIHLFVGDDYDSVVCDWRDSSSRIRIRGHSDYGFACAWHGYNLATGNQDGTCRLYDSRMLTSPIQIVNTQLGGAVRSLCFDQTGRFLAMSEPIDYVTVIDNITATCQVVNVVGQLAGIGFTPGMDSLDNLTIAGADPSVGCIAQYSLKKSSTTDLVVI